MHTTDNCKIIDKKALKANKTCWPKLFSKRTSIPLKSALLASA